MTLATTWPRKLSPSIRNDSRRDAEVRVFDALAEQLGSKWSVFYSRPWLGETSTGAEIDGECDFVVVHPDMGVLCIEVKGGGITFDAANDKWQSRDRHGLRHNIKNPVEQARRSKHELRRKVQDERGWPKAFVRFRHGVIFPDIDSVPQRLGTDMPRELFAIREDLNKIQDWISQRLSGGEEQPMGPAGVRVIEQLLARPFQLHMPLSFSGADDDKAIRELTPQQFHVLNAFEEQRRVAVGGGAGTGKTVLACEDARRRASRGLRTLITCGSERLACHLRTVLDGSEVVVETFTSLAKRLGVESGLLNATESVSVQDAPEIVFDSLSARPDLAFDAVIVDESQDFSSSTWVAIDALASRSDGSVLHAYFDSNQRLYGELRNQFDSYSLSPIRLSRNLRNTQHIHEATQRFYQGPALTADGPIGAEVRWMTVSDDRLWATVAEEVHRLCGAERVSPADVAVLSSDPSIREILGRQLFPLIESGLTLSTITDFKGLERPFVVLAATRSLADLPELAYVGLSRARVHVSVIGPLDVISWLQSGQVYFSLNK